MLKTLLTAAVDWDVLDQMPCVVRLLKVPRTCASFHDFAAYERLVDGARAVGPNAHLVVLLGGEAGLRCGEMMALEWTDVDLRIGQVSVERSEWKGHVTATKGGRVRHIPLTNRLQEALQLYRDVRGQRVLVGRRGQPLSRVWSRGRLEEPECHMGSTSCGTRSVHTSRCAEPRRVPFRNSPVTRTCQRHRVTCT